MQTSVGGSVARARAALASRDFRFVLSGRLLSQFADGVFQAYLVDRIVFLSTDTKSTALGVAAALAVLIVPYSLVGPFVGVFIDRWSRRLILFRTPLIRAVAALPLLLPIGDATWALYALALIVVSLDRLYLTTAGAVMPAVVPADDLLVGNALAGALGTVVTFLGLFVATQVAGPLGPATLVATTIALWLLSGGAGALISNPLRATLPRTRVIAELGQVAGDLARGARRLAATPPAVGGVASVTLDQILFGVATTLSVVIFRVEFRTGVASYGRILGIGGLGLILGTLTVGTLESRGLAKRHIVALAFLVSGLACVAVAPAIVAPTVLLVSFALGLLYPWKKIPVDTLAQQTVPDRFRGRVFALYDLGASMARVIGAMLAAVAVARLSTGAILAAIGVCYLAWTAVIPRWLGGAVRARVTFYAGGRADEVPRTVAVGRDEEPVEVLRSWTVLADGAVRRRFRVRGIESEMDLVEDAEGHWLVTERGQARP